MRIAILAHGTRGDVQPAVIIGDRLMRRGHHVTLAVNRDLAGFAAGAGLDVRPSGLDVGGFLRSPEAQAFLASGRFGTLVRRVTADELRVNDSIVAACVAASEGADLVLSTVSMAFRGECVAAAAGIPAAGLFCCPFAPTARWSSQLTRSRDLRLGAANRASFGPLYGLLWRKSRPGIDAMCDTLGLPRFTRRPRIEDRPSVQAYSPALAPAPDDWPARHELAGALIPPAPLRSRLGDAAMPPRLADWLDTGPSPVFFGFGSMPVLDPALLVAGLSRVTAERGLRGLIAVGWADYGPARDRLPRHLFLAPDGFDHDLVLPRCRAAVHHGGSGTTASVLRAGLPAVIASVFFDQPFWGWRVQQAGAGVTLPFRKLTSARLGRALDQVLTPGCAARAQKLGMAIRAEDGAGRAADTIERLATTRPAAPARSAR